MAIQGEENEDRFRYTALQRWGMFFARLSCVPFAYLFYKVLNRSRVIGTENIPRGNGVIFASNHVSGVDTFMVPFFSMSRFSPVPYCSPAKEELFKIPVLGRFLSLLGSYPVKRRARDFEAMKRIAYCAKNYNVMLFPEGTRSKTGELGKGRAGVGWIVYAAKPVVVPTLVINTEKYFWPGRKRPWFRIPYTIIFGKPLDLDKYYEMPDDKKTSQAIVSEIMDAISALKEKHKDLYLN